MADIPTNPFNNRVCGSIDDGCVPITCVLYATDCTVEGMKVVTGEYQVIPRQIGKCELSVGDNCVSSTVESCTTIFYETGLIERECNMYVCETIDKERSSCKP